MEIPYLPQNLTEAEKDILHLLLKSPLLNKYEVGEKLGRSYSSIYNAIKGLISKGMIEVADVRAGKKNQNIRVECYRVTEKGARQILESIRLKVNTGLISDEENPFKGVPMDVTAALVKDYPRLFPPEFQQLTERFAGILAATHMGTPTYMAIIHARLGVEKPKHATIKKALEAMTDRDLNVLINMTSRILNEEAKKMEDEAQKKRLQIKYLEGLKARS